MEGLYELVLKNIEKKGKIIKKEDTHLLKSVTVKDHKTKTTLEILYYALDKQVFLTFAEVENYKKVRASMFVHEVKKDIEASLKTDPLFRVRSFFQEVSIETTSSVLTPYQIEELMKKSTFKNEWKEEKKYYSKMIYFSFFLTLASLIYTTYHFISSDFQWFFGFWVFFNACTFCLNIYMFLRPVIRSVRNSHMLAKYK